MSFVPGSSPDAFQPGHDARDQLFGMGDGLGDPTACRVHETNYLPMGFQNLPPIADVEQNEYIGVYRFYKRLAK